jgi:uncharacterized membrane protein YgdD (TMEM256/DUF423 family)
MDPGVRWCGDLDREVSVSKLADFEGLCGSMANRFWVSMAAIVGFLAVAAGAFGAHAVAADARRMALMSTGAQYAMFHTLAVLALAALASRAADPPGALLRAAVWSFIAGSLLFSGSLWLLALDGPHLLVWVTPFGGLAFLVGWAALAVHGWQAARRRGGL